MADMKLPPPRYRIVESKGRLIVTDTWAENRPAQAETPMAPMPDIPKPSLPTMGTAQSRPTLAGSPRLPGGGGLIDTLGATLVLGVCAGSTDNAGNPILTTASHYDANGPREIVLAPAGAKRLGRWLLATVSVPLAMMIVIFATPWGFVGAFVLVGMIASNANATMRPAITHWLDRLEKVG